LVTDAGGPAPRRAS